MNVESILLESPMCQGAIGKALTTCTIWEDVIIPWSCSVCHSWFCVVRTMLYYQSFLIVYERDTGL